MRGNTVLRALAAAVLAPGLLAMVGVAPARAEGSLPAMCAGRSDPNLVLIAHANGRTEAVPKFILNVSTDAAGLPTGSLILERGRDHIVVTDICRVWQHQPGQKPKGDCEETYPEGAVTAHAVGLTEYQGETTLVRADVRQLQDGGLLFRARYRSTAGGGESMDGGEVTAAVSGDECADEGWTWIPAEEEWLPLDQVRVRVATSAG